MSNSNFLHLGKQRVLVAGIIGQTRWTGVTDIASGDSSAVVSASNVQSGDVIMTGLGITSVASHFSLNTSPNSLVSNTSFVLQTDKATVGTQPVWYAVIETSS